MHRLDLPGAAQPHLAPLQIPTQAEYRDVEPDDITTVGAERQTLDLMLCVYCCAYIVVRNTARALIFRVSD